MGRQDKNINRNEWVARGSEGVRKRLDVMTEAHIACEVWVITQGIFIPTHNTTTSADLTKLFILHVFSKHGVPSHITSDKGSEFVSHFFKSLGKALDMKLHFTLG